ncbi:MAG TPA: adenylate/guanylate cyclase domain-containing protein, partial [Elusimicrobiales bacterium]|nr:adenylate/guanylate cyclase domain-containing protein [Elusimicrobiales bacterium]
FNDSVIPSQTMLRTALQEKAVCSILDASADARFSAATSIRTSAARSVLCVPLVHAGNAFGAIYLDSDQTPFSKEDSDFCELIAGNMASLLSNKRLQHKLQQEETLRRQLRRYLPEETVNAIITKQENTLPGGTSREVTVLFSDFRGFTAAAEQLEPQKVLEMLNAHFSVIVDIIFKYNGVLDKYLGDGLMALFGVRNGDDDHALNAVKCALEMRRDLQIKLIERTRIKDRPALPLGIGINTGKVVIGDIGSHLRSDYTAIGDAVNMASRLVGLAKSGQILLTEQTYNAVKDSVKCTDLGMTKVKGKSNELKLFSAEELQEKVKKA